MIKSDQRPIRGVVAVGALPAVMVHFSGVTRKTILIHRMVERDHIPCFGIGVAAQAVPFIVVAGGLRYVAGDTFHPAAVLVSRFLPGGCVSVAIHTLTRVVIGQSRFGGCHIRHRDGKWVIHRDGRFITMTGLAFRHVLVIESKRFPIVEGMAVGALTLKVQWIYIGVVEIIRIGQTGIDHVIISIIRYCRVAVGAFRARVGKTPGLMAFHTIDFQVFAGQQAG